LEDRKWFEQRLEQHQAGIEAQLKQHQAEVFLAIQNGYRALYHQLNLQHVGAAASASTPRASTPRGCSSNGIPSLSPSDFETQQRQQDGSVSISETTTSQKKNIGPTSSKNTGPTSLHSLVVEDRGWATPPSALQLKMNGFLESIMVHVISFCILANTIIMFVQLQWLGMVANKSLDGAAAAAAAEGWPHASTVFDACEYSFTVIFLLDLVMQLFVHRQHFFVSPLNIFDFTIVVFTSLEVFVLTPLAASVGNVSFVRLLRLAKLTRVFRAARTLKTFESLRILISTMIHSVVSTFWTLVILIVFQIMASIFMCQSLHHYIVDESQSMESRLWVNENYGDGVKSFWTIFELTFSGCWPNYARRIIRDVSPLYYFFYFVYVYIVVFVMTRIVAALFTKETFVQADRDTEMMVRARLKKTEFIRRKLSDLFDEADVSSDGMVDREELRELLDHPRVNLWLKELGVDIADAEVLFALLHDGGGQITKEEFVSGICKLRGEARSSDLVPVVANVQRILGHVKALRSTVDIILLQQRMPDMGNLDFAI